MVFLQTRHIETPRLDFDQRGTIGARSGNAADDRYQNRRSDRLLGEARNPNEAHSAVGPQQHFARAEKTRHARAQSRIPSTLRTVKQHTFDPHLKHEAAMMPIQQARFKQGFAIFVKK